MWDGFTYEVSPNQDGIYELGKVKNVRSTTKACGRKHSAVYLGGGKKFDWRWDWCAECEGMGAGKN